MDEKCVDKRRGSKVFQKSRCHLKILGARNVTWNQVHTEDPQTLGVTVQNLVVWAIWQLEFGHPWICPISLFVMFFRFVLNYYIVRLVQLELNVCDRIKNVEA